MSDKRWAVFFEGGQRHDLSSQDLFALVTDMASWQSFLRVLVTGMPARMTMVRQDGVETTVVVVRTAETSLQGTFEDPYRGGIGQSPG